MFLAALTSLSILSPHRLWREVPIPRYDPNSPHQAQLAALSARAEQVGKDIAGGIQPAGQIKTSTTIRTALRESGLAEDINRTAERIVFR